MWYRRKSVSGAAKTPNELAYIAMANKLLKQWKPGVTTRVLRRTLMNMCQIDDDWNPLVFDSYCGHAPSTVMVRHYMESRKGRMVQLYRDKVVPKIDAEIDRVLQADPVRFSKLLQRINAPVCESGTLIIDLTSVE